MRFVDMIERKAEGLALSSEEIRFMVDGYVSGAIPPFLDLLRTARTSSELIRGPYDEPTIWYDCQRESRRRSQTNCLLR